MTARAATAVPNVSVAMVTYNHEKFIAKAVESVLMQETTFSIELVIGEDCSTDTTREIVRGYAAARPDIVRPLLHERNLGGHQNSGAVLAACRGEYVACLEGDDYWTDSRKLQKQVDFLVRHPECAICFHRTRKVHATTLNVMDELPPRPFRKQFQTVEALFAGGAFASTCSAVFRRCCLPPTMEKYHRFPAGDWPLFIEISLHGKIGYLDDCMAAYRFHEGGVWSRMSEYKRLEAMAEFMEFMGGELTGRLAKMASRSGVKLRRAGRRRRLLDELEEHYSQGATGTFWRLVLKALVTDPGLAWHRPYLGRLADASGVNRLRAKRL